MKQELFDKFPKIKEELRKELDKISDKFIVDLDDIESECIGNKLLESLFVLMKRDIFRYVETVFEIKEVLNQGLSDAEFREKMSSSDKERHIIHNGMIASINALVRGLKQNGKDIEWATPFFDKGRAAYASFALATTGIELLKESNKLISGR